MFDKTGTLTSGKPVVTSVTTLSPSQYSETTLLQLAAAAERSTTHPVAKAVTTAATAAAANAAPHTHSHSHGHTLTQSELTVTPGSFVQEPGSGVRATVGGKVVSVGTLEWLARQGAMPTQSQSERLSATAAGDAATVGNGQDGLAVGNSHSRIYVAVDSKVVGAIDVQVGGV